MPVTPAFEKAAIDVRKLTEDPTSEEKLEVRFSNLGITYHTHVRQALRVVQNSPFRELLGR